MQRTSQEWWKYICADKRRLIQWLRKQAVGEAQACKRLSELLKTYHEDMTSAMENRVREIALDEATHAGWIKKLLENRGDQMPKKAHRERYWKKTMPFKNAFEAFAVASHAEEMRLERIRVIVADVTAPHDIRETFQQILVDEEKHARWFREMCTDQDYENARAGHEAGMKAIGLVV